MSLRDYLFHVEPGIALYCGDARKIVPLMDPAGWRLGLIVTDPPYGIGHPTDYHARGRSGLATCRDYPPVAGDGTPFDPAWLLALELPAVLWGANHYSSRLPDASGWLVWDKERPDDLDQATCELAWTNFVKGVRRFRWLWNGMLRAGKDQIEHPTQKPTALVTWCLSLPWTPAGTVLDPYMGSGSTIEAAKLTGRQAVGIELEPAYCEVAARRLRQEVLF